MDFPPVVDEAIYEAQIERCKSYQQLLITEMNKINLDVVNPTVEEGKAVYKCLELAEMTNKKILLHSKQRLWKFGLLCYDGEIERSLWKGKIWNKIQWNNRDDIEYVCMFMWCMALREECV